MAEHEAHEGKHEHGHGYTKPEDHLPEGGSPPTTPLNEPVLDPGADLPAIHEETREKDVEKTISPSILHPHGHHHHEHGQENPPVAPAPAYGDEPPVGD